MRRSAPPRLARLLIGRFAPAADREFLVGDLEEGYRRRATRDTRGARRWYRAQVMQALRFRRRAASPPPPGPPRWSPITFLESLARDLRFGLRTMRANAAFTTVVILSLGLGIGANTAVFTVVDALILRPLPVAEPGNLVQVTTTSTRTDLFTNPQWEALRDGPRVFDDAFAVGDTLFDLARESGTERLLGSWVSGGYFSTLGLRAHAGRLITPGDDARGCAAIAVLGYAFWQREYGGDPAAVGATISLSGHPVEIVGVAPAGFRGLTAGQTMGIYVPLCAEAIIRAPGSMLDARSIWSLRVVARKPEGLSDAQMEARLGALAPALFGATIPEQWEGERRETYVGATLAVHPAGTGLSRVRDEHRASLTTLFALVAAVMLIACANVATLLLARGSSRQREMAMRVAVGAGRGRLLRQALVESLLLAAGGSLVGLLVARWSSSVLVELMSSRYTVIDIDLSLDPRVLGFTAALATLTGVLFGIAPAVRAMRVDPRVALAGGGAASSPRLGAGRAFVVVQVALSLVLVTGAVLLGASFWRLETLDPGFDREGVLLVDANLPRTGITGEARRQIFFDLLARLREMPGVRAASASDNSPISGSSSTGFIVGESAGGAIAADVEVFYNVVSDGYFTTLGTRVLGGNDFAADQQPGADNVAIVNQAAARAVFGAADAVGLVFHQRLSGERLGDPIRVIGVVEDAKYDSLREEAPPTVYLALRNRARFFSSQTYELRADVSATALLPAIQESSRQVDPSIAVEAVSLETQVSDSLRQERLMAVLSGFFGGLALFLAATGLYGIMSYSVARRGREIAVRVAIGAERGDVIGLILKETGRLVVAGAVLGCLGSLAATRLVAALLYGAEPTDPAALLTATVTLIAVGLAAGFLPARRATRFDPIVVLRGD